MVTKDIFCVCTHIPEKYKVVITIAEPERGRQMKCELKKGELIKLDFGKGKDMVRCLRGALWITTGNGVDYLLSGCGYLGELTCRSALIEALEDSELQIDRVTANIPSVGHLSSGGLRVMAEA